MNHRQRKIVKDLLNQEYSTSELSSIFDVTTRTIRNDIHDINDILEEFGGKIERNANKKLSLKIIDRTQIKEFIKKYLDFKNLDFNDTNIRIYYICLKFLYTNSYIKMDDFLDELFVSKSTLKNDFKDVKKILTKYGINFKSRVNCGLKIVGEELDIRKAISAIIYQISIEEGIINTTKNILLYEEDILQTICDIVSDNTIRANINLSDMSLNNLIIHIAIAIRRVKINQYISGYYDDDLNKTREYKIAENIVFDIEDEFELNFPIEEVYYITMHLLGTKLLMETKENVKALTKENILIEDIARRLIYYVGLELGYNLRTDAELMYGIKLHLKPAIYRYKNNMIVRNPLFCSIVENYKDIYLATKKALNIIEKDIDIVFNKDEIGYLTIHIGAAIERQKAQINPINVLVVCTTGMGTSRLLKYKLENKFAGKLKVKDTIELHKINNISKFDYDLVVSTVPLNNFSNIDYIYIKDILSEFEFLEIEKFLEKQNYRQLGIIDLEEIYLNYNFKNKEEVIYFLCNELVNKNKVSSNLYELVMKREEFSSTAFSNFVAIPHPVDIVTDKTFISIMTLKDSIIWDEKKIRFIILLLLGNDGENLNSINEYLLRIIDDEKLIQKILNCNNKLDLIKIINE